MKTLKTVYGPMTALPISAQGPGISCDEPGLAVFKHAVLNFSYTKFTAIYFTAMHSLVQMKLIMF